MTSTAPSRLFKEIPYHDRIEGDILVYTGAGKEGDQGLSGMNGRLPDHIYLRFPIYLFDCIANRRDKSPGPRRWRFLGMLEYLRHYRESQPDIRGAARSVWIFEFLIHREPSSISPAIDRDISREICARVDPDDLESRDDRQIAGMPVEDRQPSQDTAASEIADIRTRLLLWGPSEFEHLIKKVLMLSGFDRAAVTRYSQDGGVDVIAYPECNLWPWNDLLVQVQAKRRIHTVGRREVAELRGGPEPFARGVVVTTSHFSKAAVKEALAPGRIPIGLVDGIRFGSIIRSPGRGYLDQLLPDPTPEDNSDSPA